MITPRVNSAKLPEFTGKTVRLTGKVMRLEGETAQVMASDNGQVTVKLSRDAHLADTFVEIIGRVNQDNTITLFSSTNLGENIDMSIVDAVVNVTNKLPDLFPTSE